MLPPSQPIFGAAEPRKPKQPVSNHHTQSLPLGQLYNQCLLALLQLPGNLHLQLQAQLSTSSTWSARLAFRGLSLPGVEEGGWAVCGVQTQETYWTCSKSQPPSHWCDTLSKVPIPPGPQTHHLVPPGVTEGFRQEHASPGQGTGQRPVTGVCWHSCRHGYCYNNSSQTEEDAGLSQVTLRTRVAGQQHSGNPPLRDSPTITSTPLGR